MSRLLGTLIVIASTVSAATAFAEPPPGACTYDPAGENPKVEFFNCLDTTADLDGMDISRDELAALVNRLDTNGDEVLDESEFPACDYDTGADNPRVAYWNCLNTELGEANTVRNPDAPAPVREERAPTRR